MNHRIVPTNREVSLTEEEFIVSKTDPKGRITYVNRTFMKIVGFTEAELLGQPHNVIRHPDMPRGAFKLMWDMLQQGQEFMGYVKNLCKDGSFYWVFANVTPDINGRGELRGYYSVRRKPSLDALKIIEPLYREMLAIEAKAHNRSTVDESLKYLQGKLDELGSNYMTFMQQLENRG